MAGLEDFKRQAAEKAVEFVEPGMVLGLGSGSTALYAIESLARRLREGTLYDILGIPSSLHTREEALRLAIPIGTLDEHPVVDLTIDGADEMDPGLDLLKGGGGALLREKILAQASVRNLIVVDESKLSPRLGSLRDLPVEVLPFARSPVEEYIGCLGASVRLRAGENGTPFTTEQGNIVLDCDFGPIPDAALLASRLEQRAGIIAHGLFLGLADEAVVAGRDGVRLIKRRE